MDKKKLNSIRRMAGLPQDFSADRRPVITESDEIGQVLRGGKHKFYLVTPADKNSKLADVLTEVDFQSLVNIVKHAKSTKDWELVPHGNKNEALNLARERLAKVTEAVGDGAWSANADNTPYPTDEEIDAAVGGDFDDESDIDDDYYSDDLDDFEPTTNICPDCEGGLHPPAFGVCDRCDGEGEIFESKSHTCKQCQGQKKVAKKGMTVTCPSCKGKGRVVTEAKAKPDFADIDKDGDKKEPAKKAAKDKEAKEEEEEVKKCACGCDPKKCTCGADCKCGCNAKETVKESSHYYNDQYVTHTDSEQPHNVDSSYETIWDKPEENEEDYEMTNDTTPVKVPSKVLSELKRVIGEVTAEAEKAKPRDFERAHYYEATAEAMQIVHDFLAMKTVEGLKRAQIYVHKMANVSRALLPDVVWKFIIDGGQKRSLKSYVNDVKDPVSGKPFGVVDVKTLNKNTHTE